MAAHTLVSSLNTLEVVVTLPLLVQELLPAGDQYIIPFSLSLTFVNLTWTLFFEKILSSNCFH
jgi:hypothetical protein